MKNKVKSSSSEKKLSRRKIAAIATSAYILFLILGIVFTFLIPFFWNKNRLLDIAEYKGEYTLTHYTNDSDSDIPVEYYLFTDEGYLVTSDRALTMPYWGAELREMVPELISNTFIYRFHYFKSESGSRLSVIAGRTVTAASGKTFASFVVRDLSEMIVTMTAFAGVFSFLFLLSMFIIFFIMKQHDELNKLQKDLISNVSHELKTPITSIKAMAELLYDGMYRTDEDRKRYSGTIIQESDRLNDLVKEMLNLSRLQSKREKFNIEHCHADGVFNPVIDRYMMMCQDTGIEMDVSRLDLASLPSIYTDHDQLAKVWMIILDNAMKFAGKGGHIELTREVKGDKIIFCISDNGPGISPQDIKRIFERFYKADTAHNSKGSGLGLAIAYEIIQRLHERIWVESTEGEGSSFYFTVSIDKVAERRSKHS